MIMKKWLDLTKKTSQKSDNVDFNKVWLMFQETDKQLKETRAIIDDKFSETDLQIQKI